MFRKNSKQVSAYFIVATLVATFVIQLFAPLSKVNAAALSKEDTITWKTAEHFVLNDGRQFTFTSKDGSLRVYTNGSGCTDRYLVNSDGRVSFSKATLSNTPGNVSCAYDGWSIPKNEVTNQQEVGNKYTVYYWEDSKTIKRLNTGLDGTVITSMSYTRDSANPSYFYEDVGVNGCKDQFIIESNTRIGYRARSDKRESQVMGWTADGKKIQEDANEQEANCYITKQVGLYLGFPENASAAVGTATPVPGSGSGGATGADGNAASPPDETCEGGGLDMGWIVCKIAGAADKFASFTIDAIANLMRVGDMTNDTSGIKQGWASMRAIASSLIVLVALVMIASQIFSFDFMSAYTIKKVLPRLIAAAILIQLSWFLLTTMIIIVNGIGDGIAALLYVPWPGLGEAVANGNSLAYILNTFADSYNIGAGTYSSALILTGIGVAAGWGAVGGMFGLLFAAIGIVIACLVAFVTLVFRKVLILALLVIAPLAFVAWILPGTQKWWDKWWDMFSKLLIMYPLVIGLLTFGTIAAYLAASSGTGAIGPAAITSIFAAPTAPQATVVFFIILICFFGPFFFIPSMMKLGGTILAKASTYASTGGDALKKARPMRNLEKARDNNKAGRDYNAKLKGINRASGGTWASRNKVFGGAARRYGRLQAGTGGATGAYATQLRGSERDTALKNASTQISEDIKELGLADYDDQLDYRMAIIKGDSKYTDRSGKTHKVRDYGQTGQAAALDKIAEAGKGDRLREAKAVLTSRGVKGEQTWTSMMDTRAGKVVSVAADASGKGFQALRASEMATQEPGSWRNMAREYDDAVVAAAAGDAAAVAKVAALHGLAADISSNNDLKAQLNPESQEYMNYVNGGGGAAGTPPPSGYTKGQDYKGHETTRQVKGQPKGTMETNPEFSAVPTFDTALNNAKNAAKGSPTGKF